MGTSNGTMASMNYNANIRYHTMRVAMTQMIKDPPYAFRDVAKTHFSAKRREITAQLEQWRQDFVKNQQNIARSGLGFFQPFDTTGAPNSQVFDAAVVEVHTVIDSLVASASASAVSASNVVDLVDDEALAAATTAPTTSSSSTRKPKVPITGEVIELLEDDKTAIKKGSSHSFVHFPQDGFLDEDDDEEDDDDGSGVHWGNGVWGAGIFGGSDDDEGQY